MNCSEYRNADKKDVGLCEHSAPRDPTMFKTWSPFGIRGLSVYCITKCFTVVSKSTLRMTARDVLRCAFVADDQTRKAQSPLQNGCVTVL